MKFYKHSPSTSQSAWHQIGGIDSPQGLLIERTDICTYRLVDVASGGWDVYLEGFEDPNNPGKKIIEEYALTTIQQVETTYSYTNELGLSLEEVAEILLIELMEDLTIMGDNRNYIITDYKLGYKIIEAGSPDEYLLTIPLDENTWCINAGASIKYEGIFSPIGYHESIPDRYHGVPLGDRYLVKEDNTYYLYHEMILHRLRNDKEN